jgi:type III secretory pathway component EscT
MSDDYVSLYLNSPFLQDDLGAFFSLLFLFFARVFPIITLAPFFGAKVLPHSTKAALGICFFIIFFPQLSSSLSTPLTFSFTLVLFFIKELFVGFVIGFLVSLPFIIVQNAGILIDHQRGGASLMVNDPTMQNQSSPLGTMYNLLLIFLFFQINGPFLVIDIIEQSFRVLPVDQFIREGFFSSKSEMYASAVKILGNVMILSTQLAAPALIMILMTDFFLGIANRLAPQVQITFLGMPLKSLLALVIVYFGWGLFNEEIVRQTYRILRIISSLVDNFQPATG